MDTNEYLDMLIIKSEIEKNVINKDAVISGLARFLRTTNTYRECKSLYCYYIMEIAKFIRNIEPSDSIEATLYLDYMLRIGFLSCTGQNMYHNYAYEEECLFDLMGARTVSGVSVCRHMSSFVTDILNLNYIAGWLSVKCGEDIEDFVNTGESGYNHAIVGVESGTEKILYDPTVGAFAKRATSAINPLYAQRIGETFHSYIRLESIAKFFLLNTQKAELNNGSQHELQIIFNAPLAKINEEEFKEKLNKINVLCHKTFFAMCDFQKAHQELTIQISKLEKELIPRSDEPIKKWLVRR